MQRGSLSLVKCLPRALNVISVFSLKCLMNGLVKVVENKENVFRFNVQDKLKYKIKEDMKWYFLTREIITKLSDSITN